MKEKKLEKLEENKLIRLVKIRITENKETINK
jgi:hypothetical protein